MGKVTPQVDENLFKRKKGATPNLPPIQKVMPVFERAEPEATILFRAPHSFKDRLDLYLATHKAELKEIDSKTKKAFCTYVLEKYMDEHP